MHTLTLLVGVLALLIAITALVLACVFANQSSDTEVASENGFAGEKNADGDLVLRTTAEGLLTGASGALQSASAQEVTSQLLAGFAPQTGAVTAQDSILTAIAKLSGSGPAGTTDVVSWAQAAGPGVAMGFTASTNRIVSLAVTQEATGSFGVDSATGVLTYTGASGAWYNVWFSAVLTLPDTPSAAITHFIALNPELPPVSVPSVPIATPDVYHRITITNANRFTQATAGSLRLLQLNTGDTLAVCASIADTNLDTVYQRVYVAVSAQ